MNSRAWVAAGLLLGTLGHGSWLYAQSMDAVKPGEPAAAANAAPEKSDPVLRVCADPSSLPQSNDRGEGYENKIAEALARDLGKKVEYTYFPQRMGFVRNT